MPFQGLKYPPLGLKSVFLIEIVVERIAHTNSHHLQRTHYVMILFISNPMATLQSRFHYPYVPDEEIELGKV